MIIGILGKVAGVLVAIPYPVLGGIMVVYFGMAFGVILGNLYGVALKSTRNACVLGISMMIGFMTPLWVEKHPNALETGII